VLGLEAHIYFSEWTTKGMSSTLENSLRNKTIHEEKYS
jgi:hypothetical protein